MTAYGNHQVRAQRLQVFLTGCIQQCIEARTASEADGQFPATSVNQATRPPDRQAATPTASSEDICPDTTSTRRYLGSSSFRKKAKVRPSSDMSRRTIRRTEGKASAVK